MSKVYLKATVTRLNCHSIVMGIYIILTIKHCYLLVHWTLVIVAAVDPLLLICQRAGLFADIVYIIYYPPPVVTPYDVQAIQLYRGCWVYSLRKRFTVLRLWYHVWCSRHMWKPTNWTNVRNRIQRFGYQVRLYLLYDTCRPIGQVLKGDDKLDRGWMVLIVSSFHTMLYNL